MASVDALTLLLDGNFSFFMVKHSISFEISSNSLQAEESPF